jgi:hypothetical protein
MRQVELSLLSHLSQEFQQFRVRQMLQRHGLQVFQHFLQCQLLPLNLQ